MKNKTDARALLAAIKHDLRSAQELLEALEMRNRMDAEILAHIRAATDEKAQPQA